jgi:hypothetical protein
VTAAGLPQWTVDGVALCTAANNQLSSAIVSDGAGGAIVTWYDLRNGTNYDIYAQRVTTAGVPQWTVDGVAVCTAANNQLYPTIVSDGAGGAIVTWQDTRGGVSSDIYAQRMNAAGVPQWIANGVALSTAAAAQANPTIVTDGAGGAIVTWYDFRSGTNYDIYAQRIESFGNLGNPEPSIAGVRDVPNDQGGQVKVSWSASYLDGAPTYGIDSYWILRSAPPNAVARAVRDGARLMSDPAAEPVPGVRNFLASPKGLTDYAWEYIASQPAFHVSTYSYVAPTTSDSVGAGNPRTAFMVMARSPGGYQWWFSAPDSGYSVDNLPPSAPAPFTGAYSAGATHLHWGANSEIDLAGYRLYRGSSSGFTPGPGNLISAQPDTGYADAGAAGSWYKLSAIDAHGNQSLYATLGPNGTLDAPGGGSFTLALSRPSPNPAWLATTIHFALPEAEPVRLAIYDPAGRRVRMLVQGILDAGAHQTSFDLRDDDRNRLAGGLYFVRLETPERSLTTRMVAIP